jgi:decaprenyl-phosphate phosphoribosyltransferase
MPPVPAQRRPVVQAIVGSFTGSSFQRLHHSLDRPQQHADGGPRAGLSPGVLLRALRVRQWLKNLLVFGAPLAAGRLLEGSVLAGALVAFVVFCAAASCIYLVNDVRDVEADRSHPEKRHRPIAAGELSGSTALLLAAPLGVGALLLAFAWSLPLGFTLLAYLAVQAGYAIGLKDEPGIDLVAVSSGFLLRAIAGGTAAGIVLSPWFLLVAAFGSLFMVAGKRYSEIHRLGATSASRRSLQQYSDTYLRFIWTMAAGVTVVVYILWALNGRHADDPAALWGSVSVAPFVLGLLRYAADIDRGSAESPEEIVLGDRHLQVIGALWLVTLVLHTSVG